MLLWASSVPFDPVSKASALVTLPPTVHAAAAWVPTDRFLDLVAVAVFVEL